MRKYGFIGLGSQGGPMAQRMIDAGLDVVLWARRKESLEPYAQTSATIAETIKSVAEQVVFCGVCVVDDAGVQMVCDQLIPSMKPGGIIAIHSTIHPELCIALAEKAKSNGLMLVDAPVSGGGEGAANGTLTVMVGGEEEAVSQVRPVFETYAGLITHLGDVGAGQKAKLVNNNLMAANMALAYHALKTAETLGLDREAFIELVRVSSGRSFSFDVCARLNEPSDFKLGAPLLTKDVRLLAETIGENANYKILKDVASSFLEQALAE